MEKGKQRLFSATSLAAAAAAAAAAARVKRDGSAVGGVLFVLPRVEASGLRQATVLVPALGLDGRFEKLLTNLFKKSPFLFNNPFQFNTNLISAFGPWNYASISATFEGSKSFFPRTSLNTACSCFPLFFFLFFPCVFSVSHSLAFNRLERWRRWAMLPCYLFSLSVANCARGALVMNFLTRNQHESDT